MELNPMAEHTSPDALLIRRISWIMRQTRRRFDQEASAMGLTYSRARALRMIAQDEGLTQTQLAEELEVETPTVKRLIDGLEEAGFVERRATESDKRANSLHLTETGRDLRARIEEFTANIRREIFSGITPAEIELALSIFDRVATNFTETRTEENAG
jgi:MarR family transcriptional regulator for hemolysin